MTGRAAGGGGRGRRRPTVPLAPVLLGLALVAAALAGGSIVVGPAPAVAQSAPSSCPAMTDSVTRLYHAFFRREPDADGFRHWVRQYQTGAMSLEQIADAFLRSQEFAARQIGSNHAFVDWLYTDVVVAAVKGPIARAAYWFNQKGIDGVIDGAGTTAVRGGRFVYDKIDQGVVDTLVNGSGAAAEGSGQGLRQIQTGRVQQYAALLFAATAVLAGIFIIVI